MEIRVDVKGVSCHGSAPERGDNAIYKMADIVSYPLYGSCSQLSLLPTPTVSICPSSCHGSAPERGDNAIYKMADIVQEIRALNENDDADEYFFTDGSARISSKQLSQVSPAVILRSTDTAQLSATAHRLGDV